MSKCVVKVSVGFLCTERSERASHLKLFEERLEVHTTFFSASHLSHSTSYFCFTELKILAASLVRLYFSVPVQAPLSSALQEYCQVTCFLS